MKLKTILFTTLTFLCTTHFNQSSAKEIHNQKVINNNFYIGGNIGGSIYQANDFYNHVLPYSQLVVGANLGYQRYYDNSKLYVALQGEAQYVNNILNYSDNIRLGASAKLGYAFVNDQDRGFVPYVKLGAVSMLINVDRIQNNIVSANIGLQAGGGLIFAFTKNVYCVLEYTADVYFNNIMSLSMQKNNNTTTLTNYHNFIIPPVYHTLTVGLQFNF